MEFMYFFISSSLTAKHKNNYVEINHFSGVGRGMFAHENKHTLKKYMTTFMNFTLSLLSWT